MADIITRSGKGAALTHAEMDQNLTNLNDEIASNQADALLKHLVMPEAQFMALAAANRERFASSGFINWGANYTVSESCNVNNGLVAYGAQTWAVNRLDLGIIDSYASLKESETIYPLINVNGFILRIDGVGSARSSELTRITLPPAPAISSLLERQDLIIIDVWPEKILDKGMYYPYGNIQTLMASDPVTGVSTVAGSFAGYDTYSLFSEDWQSPGALVGRGLVWSTLSDSNKKKIVSNRHNNIYLSSAGDLVQVRYRVRVIEGLGGLFEKVDTQAANVLSYDTDNRIARKGANVSIVSDYTSESLEGYNTNPNYSVGDIVSGQWNYRAADTSASYTGNGYAIPVAIVSRRNQGAFHDVYNDNGSRKWKRDGANLEADLWYVKGQKVEPQGVDDAFTMFTYSNDPGGVAGAYDASGYIGSTADSGRPDGYFFDAIYSDDVKDIRISAHEVDLDRILYREVGLVVSGDKRGWGAGPFAGVELGVVESRTTLGSASTFEIDDYSLYSPGDRIAIYSATDNALLVSGFIGNINATGYGSVYPTYAAAIKDDAADRTTFSRTNGDVYTIFRESPRALNRKANLCCDIVGSPKNFYRGYFDYLSSEGTQTITVGQVVKIASGSTYGTEGHYYQRLLADGNSLDLATTNYENSTYWSDLGADLEDSWHKTGVMGTVHLNYEDGSSVIDGSVSVKLSRPATSVKLVLVSIDQGKNFTVYTGYSGYSATTNRVGLDGGAFSSRVYKVFYIAEANPFEVANNAYPIKKLPEIFGSSSILSTHLISNLINKVPVVNLGSAGFSALISSALSLPSLELSDSTSISRQPEHNDVTKYLTNANVPAVKVLFYLSVENLRLYLQLLFKEMVYDDSLDNLSEFTSVDGTVSYSFVAGNYYRITGLSSDFSVYCVSSIDYAFSGFTPLVNGDWVNDSGSVYFKTWNGSGWGDDNLFNVVDGVGTSDDDNGNICLAGHVRLELPFMVGKAA